jgi:transglutaminase-like putative cysteine protease
MILRILCVALALAIWSDAADAADRLSPTSTTIGPDGSRKPVECVLRIANPNGLYSFREYACPSFSQSLKRLSDTSIEITVQSAPKLPSLGQPWPLESIPPEVERFTRPSARIQSDHPSIIATARKIVSEHQPKTEAELTTALLAWVRTNVRPGSQNKEITDALTALNRRSSQCIGFAHLSVALLRSQGVPVRPIRTYHLCDCSNPRTHFTRHSLIEVYYPDEKQWILYEPQSPAAPCPGQIFLYSDVDWNQSKHDECKPFSLDPETSIEVLSVR